MSSSEEPLDSTMPVFSKTVELDGSFVKLMEEIKDADIHLPSKPVIISGLEDFNQNRGSYVITLIEDDFAGKQLDIFNGCDIAHSNNVLISAYDESIAYYSSLEGKVAYISHSLVTMYKNQYYPLNRLNLIFSTKSELVHSKIPGSILADKWDVDITINVEVAKQKKQFLIDNAINNSLLLIDGPFLAGDGSFYFYDAVEELYEKNIVPIFIVKNSNASILVDNLVDLKGVYNSDLHYANEILTEGTRTQFFKYISNTGNKTKVFCYLKHKDHNSPIRIEIPTLIFEKNREVIENSMDLIYYLIKVQGNNVNPQVRLIAIAEMFARETLGLININKDSIQMKLTATMNEQRGME